MNTCRKVNQKISEYHMYHWNQRNVVRFLQNVKNIAYTLQFLWNTPKLTYFSTLSLYIKNDKVVSFGVVRHLICKLSWPTGTFVSNWYIYIGSLFNYFAILTRIILIYKTNASSMQIVNWRTHLKFPEEAKLSLEAKDLMSKLLCNVDQRLGTRGAHEIKVLPPFYCFLQNCLSYEYFLGFLRII